MIWFTSDLHLNHQNICRGESSWDGKKGTREYDSVAEMNGAILKSLECVQKDDTLFILGDVVLCVQEKAKWVNENIVRVAERIGYTVTFIRGNHDWGRKKDGEVGAKVCDLWEGSLEVKSVKRRMTLCHYPIVSWAKMGKGAYMLYGHCHGNLGAQYTHGRMLDVGWDVWGRPLSFTEIVAKLDKVPPIKTDHHGANSE